MRNNKHQLIGALLGTIIEYYDYSLYGFSAGIIASKFLTQSDYITNLTNAFAIYAIAYLAKPIGALIFGYIGDYYGRKISLNVTIIGIVVPTVIIGILPEYSSIGIYSIIILSLCRFVQGIFAAGEYDGAAIYLIEHIGAKYRYTASAITRFSGVIGLLLGIAASNFFTSHIFPEWCWRIPFLFSVPLAMIALYYRSKIDETPDFKNTQNNTFTIIQFKSIINQHWFIVLKVIILAGGFGATYQVSIIFMKQYLPIVLPQTSLIISSFSIFIVLCFGLSMPLSGFLADRIGIILVIKISLYMTLLASVLLMIAIEYSMVNLALSACIMLATAVGPFNGLSHALLVKSFEVNMRYRAIAIGHTTGSMLISGSANYICLKAIQILKFNLFPIIYVMLFAVVAYNIMVIFQNKPKT